MPKTFVGSAAAVLAAAALLTACSTSAKNAAPATVTVTESAAAATTTTATTATTTAATTPAAAASASTAGFDANAIRAALQAAGYQQVGDDLVREVNGARYEIDVDLDSISLDLRNAGADVTGHTQGILADAGAALGTANIGGTTWSDIQTWALANPSQARTVLGSLEVDTDKDLDEDFGLDVEFLGR